MRRSFNRLVACSVAGCIAGCASFSGVQTSTAPNLSSYSSIMKKVDAQQKRYWDASADWANSEFWFSVGMIGLAMGSVAVAAFSHGAAKANLLTGVGIGVGGVSLYQSAVNGPAKQQAYTQASKQLLCLKDRAMIYATWPDPAEQGARDAESGVLAQKEVLLSQAINTLDRALSKVGGEVPAAGLSAEQTAVVYNGNSVLAQAQALDVVAQGELAAGSGGLNAIATTFQLIDSRAYTAAKTSVVTWNQAGGAFGGSPTPPKPSAVLVKQNLAILLNSAALKGAGTVDQDIAAVAVASIAIVDKNNTISASALILSKRYSTANAAIKACANE